MTTWPHEPVLVVGAGPVGQTAALLLARWGVPTVVCDRRPARDHVGSKAICQQRDVLDVWASVGAGAIADEGLTWTTARTFHGDRELFAQTFADAGTSPFPPFVNLSQSRTEEILDACIAAEPLIDLRWGCEVTELDPARFTVLATGASGTLRRTLGVTFEGRSFDDRFLICDVRTDLPGWVAERRFFFDPAWNPGRQVLVHPCPDSVFRIDWQVPAGYDLDGEHTSGALDRRIRAVIGERAYELVWSSVYRFHSRIADRMRLGRILLAGDAAHLMAPFGARGLNSGVADAENAAWKIAHVGHGWAGEGLLESYHAERHAAARENLAVTGATMDFLVPPDADRAAHRADVLARAAHDPAARALVDSGRLSEPFWYTDSPLTTPDPSRPFAGRPPKGEVPMPAPGVLIPDLPAALATAEPDQSHPSAAEPDQSHSSAAAPGPAMRHPRLAEPDRSHPGAVGLDAVGRVRELARQGFLVLTTAGVDLTGVRTIAAVSAAPVQVAPLAELDPSGQLAAVLGARSGEVWVIRPDAHIAAVVGVDGLAAALSRALGDRVGSDISASAGAFTCPSTRSLSEQEVEDAVLPPRG